MEVLLLPGHATMVCCRRRLLLTPSEVRRQANVHLHHTAGTHGVLLLLLLLLWVLLLLLLWVLYSGAWHTRQAPRGVGATHMAGKRGRQVAWGQRRRQPRRRLLCTPPHGRRLLLPLPVVLLLLLLQVRGPSRWFLLQLLWL
jgi:hypothetical protein